MSEHVERAEVAGLVMLAPGDPERARAEAHASTCARCADELGTARSVLSSLGALETGLEASPERLERVRAAVEVERARPATSERALAWASAALAVLCAAVAAAVFRGFSESVLSWVTAGVALVLGLGAILSVRDEASGRASTIVASTGALALAMLSIEPGTGVEWEHAAYCGGTQLLGALAPALVVLVVPSAEPPRGWALAGRGAGGALVALAALLLVCPAHSAAHVLVFHVLSIAAATGIATVMASATLARRRTG